MKRWLWGLVFLLSVGLNLGWFSQYLLRQQRTAEDQAIVAELDASVAELAEESAADGGPQLTQPGRLPSASAGPRGMPGPLPRFLERMADVLKLEGAPREEFLQLQRQYFRQAWQQRRELASLQHQVRRQVVSPQPDRRQVDNLLRQISELQYTLESQFVHHLLDSRELLDGPRERRYLQLMSRFRRMRANRWEGTSGRPLGPGAPRPERPSER